MSEELKSMKQTLLAAAQSQMGNLGRVNAEELGEVIDMIKDIEEAEYYCAITKAMEEGKKEKEDSEKMRMSYMKYLDPRYDGTYTGINRMYYDGGMGNNSSSGNGNMGGNSSSNNGNSGGSRGFTYPPEMRDYREGRSPMSRRGYMESKEMHQDSGIQLHKLEKYVDELSSDIVEMTENSSPEEKNLLYQKLVTLANKIQ